MGDLVLRQSSEDRRRYDVEGIGSIRRMSLFSRTALLLPVDGEPLTAQSRGLLSGEAEAVTPKGEVVGAFTRPDLLTRGGEIAWHGRRLRLRTTPVLVSRYSLRDGETTLLDLQATGWGTSPAQLTVHEATDPGLVLFVLWLAQGFVDHDSGRGRTGAAATT
ncbi:hypothetical protein J2X46_002392 [Nocardioides sp. BE266]|uniref:hypothetical protein n=1 Tax=Nocardioides sp. BE266 TaxID=2817725 RepID=UPI00286036D7|nr:hypothetical protein [Nocardioides sp. BE266]MDR7253407.1 hypothetical protein [Nocardioides sp. BE266]